MTQDQGETTSENQPPPPLTSEEIRAIVKDEMTAMLKPYSTKAERKAQADEIKSYFEANTKALTILTNRITPIEAMLSNFNVAMTARDDTINRNARNIQSNAQDIDRLNAMLSEQTATLKVTHTALFGDVSMKNSPPNVMERIDRTDNSLNEIKRMIQTSQDAHHALLKPIVDNVATLLQERAQRQHRRKQMLKVMNVILSHPVLKWLLGGLIALLLGISGTEILTILSGG